MKPESYVCAFRGRRDDYQVPWALEEAGRLECFITDAYVTPQIAQLSKFIPKERRKNVFFRHSEGIPDAKVRCLWGTTFLEHVRHRLGFSPVATWAKLDQAFSRAAANEARRTRSHLFLYTPYAWEAFQERYSHNPRKVLFEYHPHPSVEGPILSDDAARYPEIQHSYTEATGNRLPEHLRQRIADAWKFSDLIVTASSYTRETLIAAGADGDKCVVIPYGVRPCAVRSLAVAEPRGFKALFVGSGVQRKGLHHLLRAWRLANLDSQSSLTLVCRNLDPGLRAMVAASPRTILLRGTSAGELARLYQESTLFVMPSLTEGFGQVYLEALSHGCPVLGTLNTALPDLGSEADGIFTVCAGNVEELAQRLEFLSRCLPENFILRERARMRADFFSPPRFRNALAQLL